MKKERKKKKNAADEEQKKKDDAIASVIEVQGRNSSASPTAESELTMNDNNNDVVGDLMDLDTPSKNPPQVDIE
jgi:hypothetical protein